MSRYVIGSFCLAVSVFTLFQVSQASAQVQYAPRVEYPAGDGPSSVFASDLDGDSIPDLAVTCGYDNIVSVYINNGDGTLMSRVDYSVGNRPQSVFAADLDGDGDNDLAVVNRISNDLSVLKNNGDGTFAPKLTYSTGFNPLYVIGALLDSDSLIDLAVANFIDGTVSVLINQGNGSFGFRTDYPVGSGPYAVCAADLDGDSIPDLASANGTGDSATVLLNDGSAGFTARTDYSAGDNPRGITAADLDGDDQIDLAVANWEGFSVSVFKNSGGGIFSPGNEYATGVHPTSLTAADFDGDTLPDLAVGSAAGDFSCGSDVIPVLINDGSAAFNTRVDLESIYDPHAITAADLDGDLQFEMITVHSPTDQVVVTDFPDSALPASCSAIPGDANADGNLTLADVVAAIRYVLLLPPYPTCQFGNDRICWFSGLLCRGDWNGTCTVSLGDVIWGVNYIFDKPGGPWDPQPSGPCCQPVP